MASSARRTYQLGRRPIEGLPNKRLIRKRTDAMETEDSCVGRIAALTRYPVKSMAGEALADAEVDWQGMEGDRQYAFVRRGNTSRFPWLTGRDTPGMVLHRATYIDAGSPRTSAVRVTDPTGTRWDLRDPALSKAVSDAAEMEVDLLQLGIGAYDLMPLSIVTTASLADLETRHGRTLDSRRFRANIVVESSASDRDWAGRLIRFGDEGGVELVTTYLAPRCAMITIDPRTAERDASVMRTIAQDFEGAFTMYATVAKPGMLRVGDQVRLRPL